MAFQKISRTRNYNSYRICTCISTFDTRIRSKRKECVQILSINCIVGIEICIGKIVISLDVSIGAQLELLTSHVDQSR